jgi:carboxypeptidase C (cathepsin A)
MNVLDVFKTLLGKGIVEPVATYYTRKQELKQAKFEAQLKFEQAKGERAATLITQGLAADASWEMLFANQAASSWKDEYTLVVCSIPLVMAFIPGLDVYVTRGFAAFSATPLWYQVMVQTMFYATVGIRLWRRSQSDT